MSYRKFSANLEYELLYELLNEMVFQPLHRGIKSIIEFINTNMLRNNVTIISLYLADFDFPKLNSTACTHGRSSHLMMMHYLDGG